MADSLRYMNQTQDGMIRYYAERVRVPIMRELDRVMVRGILDLCGVRSRTSEEQLAMTKAGICAAKDAVKELKENPQKFYDKYYNIKNQKNEEQL